MSRRIAGLILVTAVVLGVLLGYSPKLTTLEVRAIEVAVIVAACVVVALRWIRGRQGRAQHALDTGDYMALDRPWSW